MVRRPLNGPGANLGEPGANLERTWTSRVQTRRRVQMIVDSNSDALSSALKSLSPQTKRRTSPQTELTTGARNAWIS